MSSKAPQHDNFLADAVNPTRPPGYLDGFRFGFGFAIAWLLILLIIGGLAWALIIFFGH